MNTERTKQRIKLRRPILIVSVFTALVWALSACGSGGAAPGDSAGPGERIFATHCAVCHATNSEPGIGPGLAGLFAPGGPALPTGIDYAGNLPNGAAITDANVAAWIRAGGQGRIGRMPPIALSEQEMTDLLTYLKTLEP